MVQIRTMQNGRGWYWEVVAQDRDVIASGIADTQAQARADAERASRSETLIHDIGVPDNGSEMNGTIGGRYIRLIEARNLRNHVRTNVAAAKQPIIHDGQPILQASDGRY
jgi:hypothetical protein